MSETLTIKRPVLVIVKVTEGFKARMAAEIQENIKKLDAELQQLEFQLKRITVELEKKNPQGLPAAKQHVENERQKRLTAKSKLTEQLKNIGRLAIGTEVVQGSLESYTEINIGDDWEDIMGVEVVVCDNKIIDIRRRNQSSDE
ncbi:YlqD family protein [Phosphitispora sp. TUW77]|uniref:YlqD family protein n=1 Tax=Phosphitispora sp. TUW77 TaxID=3152361 RepID=UPI003AB8B834